jgi:sarcosine oxidase subunit beta
MPTYDVVVIGAGVMGASSAFHLARAGARVLVLERGAVCSGMTRRSGALVRMHYTNEPEARLARKSLDYFRNWREEVGVGSCGFVPTGFAMLVAPENAERLRRNVAMLQRVGVNTRVVTAQELRDLQPQITTDDIRLAAYEPESGYADPVATTESFIQAARLHGAEVRTGTTVTAIVTAGGRVAGVRTTAGDVAADAVLCAANVWSPALLRTAGVELDVRPHRSQVTFWTRPPELAVGHLVLIDTALGVYSRPHGSDLSLAGVSRARPLAGEIDAFNPENDPEIIPEVQAQLARRLPPFAAARYVRGHAGLYDMSPDTRAILDRAPGVDGLYLAAGFSGTGFKKAPAVGLGMAELILHGRATSVDLHPFRYGRFAENDPIRGPDEYEVPAGWGHRF